MNVWPMVAQVPLIKRMGARRDGEHRQRRPSPPSAFEVGLVNAVAPAEELRGTAEPGSPGQAAAPAGVYGGRPFFEIDEMP